MNYILKIDEEQLMVEDCFYHLFNEELHEIKIIGVLYGSKDYEILKDKLNVPFDMELVYFNNNETFAKLSEVTLDNVEYHLKMDDVNFYGTFKSYAENTKNIEELMD